jgi:hypothetical protein
MAYEKQTWEDGSGGGTPLSAARLQHLEDGLEAAAAVADSAGGGGSDALVFNILDHGGTNDNTGDVGAVITSLSSTLDAAGGGTIYLPPGEYRCATTGTINSPRVSLVGAGSGTVTLLTATGLGTSPCLDISARADFSVQCAGRFGGFWVDGTNTSSGVGVRFGDMVSGHLYDLTINNFTTGTGLHFVNRTNWTERTLITGVRLFDNRIGWHLDINGGNDSFGYTRCLDLALNIEPVTATTSRASVTTTAGSTTATVASGGYTGVTVGMSVDGVGLYGGTTVAAVSGNNLTLSQPASASGTVTLTFAAACQIGILVDSDVYFYNSLVNIICNAESGTEGTNQAPVLLQANGNVSEISWIVQGEAPTGKATAANVPVGGGLTGDGASSLPGFSPGYRGGDVSFEGNVDFQFSDALISNSRTFHPGADGAALRVENGGDPVWKVFADGGIGWGDGSGDVDVSLYRSAAGEITTDDFVADSVSVHGTDGDTEAVQLDVTGDANNRFILYADGQQSWGPGSATQDTTLYRMGSGVLATDGDLRAYGGYPVVATSVIRQDSSYTLSNSAAVQQLFNGSTNGRVTLPTGTYRFNALISLSAMSSTSGNSAFSLAVGTATIGTVLMMAIGVDGATATAAALNGAMAVTSAFPASQHTAAAATTQQSWITGTFEVTAAGTVIPSVQLANAAAAVVAAGSFFEVWRIGADSLTNVGGWT